MLSHWIAMETKPADTITPEPVPYKHTGTITAASEVEGI